MEYTLNHGNHEVTVRTTTEHPEMPIQIRIGHADHGPRYTYLRVEEARSLAAALQSALALLP